MLVPLEREQTLGALELEGSTAIEQARIEGRRVVRDTKRTATGKHTRGRWATSNVARERSTWRWRYTPN